MNSDSYHISVSADGKLETCHRKSGSFEEIISNERGRLRVLSQDFDRVSIHIADYRRVALTTLVAPEPTPSQIAHYLHDRYEHIEGTEFWRTQIDDGQFVGFELAAEYRKTLSVIASIEGRLAAEVWREMLAQPDEPPAA